jgi:hypothetical protein
MNISDWTLVITTCLIAPGWLATYYFGLRQAAIAKRREFRLQYQIDSYRALMERINSGISSQEEFHVFERCINDVMLFGSQQQIDIVRSDINQGDITVGRLLISLRNGLRAELGLPTDMESGGWGMSWSAGSPETAEESPTESSTVES